MPKFRVSWIERRIHYIDVEANSEYDAIEMAQDADYKSSASDSSSYDEYTAIRQEPERE